MTDDFIGVQKRHNPIEGFFQRTPLKTDPFAGNRSAERVYARSERIVAALYLLTNHIHESEPLRSSVRVHALSLLDVVLSIRDGMRSPESAEIVSLRSLIRLLISLVRMLVVSGSISSQNAEIMVESLDELGNFITTSQRSTLSENISFSREDLDVAGSLIGHQGTSQKAIKDIKDTGDIKDNRSLKDTSSLSVIKSSSDLSHRRRSILEVLGSGRELGIRDISSNVPQYSEKMIQRELVELVALGFVKKTGFKRWSRYSILKR